MFAPAATPRAITRQVNAQVNRVLQQPDVRDQFLKIGMVPIGVTSEALAQYLEVEIARWAKVVRDANIQPVD